MLTGRAVAAGEGQMFDNIGKSLDEEANKRQAASFALTLAMLGLGTAVFVGITMWTAAQVVQNTDLLDDMVELIEEEIMQDDAPPPPPPPPPPAAASASEEEDVEDDPDEMVEEIKELTEEVKEEVKSEARPAGVEGGVEGGVAGGVVGGVQGGVIGGVVGGQLGAGVKVFHSSELEVKKKVQPEYPDAARELSLGDQRCLVKVLIDEEGVPYDVRVESCPKVFEAVTREAMLKWRWYPPRDGKNKVRAQTTIAITYKLN
jgi:periplasmic protein TonB